MSFLKSMWKINGKHKKLNEEMVLTSSLRDFVESPLDFNDEELTDDPIVYNLKYLGSTSMTSSNTEDEKINKKLKFNKKSQMITTSAIKRVIAASKSQKKLKEVTISISPKGIFVVDQMSDEQIAQVPIHRISYCSIDAAHDTIFSFVSSPTEAQESSTNLSNHSLHFGSKDSPVGELESNSLEDDEGLVLHAFQCQKRKVAHNVTMTVARSFERAYQIYQNDQFLKEVREKNGAKVGIGKENLEAHKNAVNIKKTITDDSNGCLIDLGSENGPELNEICSTKHSKDYFQTTWVSFE